MRKFVTFLVLIAVAGGAWYYYGYAKPEAAPEIIQATVSRGTITETVKATGTIEAIRTVDIGSQISGMVKKLHVDFNDVVRAGQLIAEIDPDLFDVQVKIQEANIEQRKTDIDNQKVQLEDAQVKLRRAQELMARGLTAQQDLETAQLAVKNREAQIANLQKQLVSAQANLEQAELNLSYTRVYSPIEGVIVNRHVDEGQFVQSSMTSPQFFTIATDLRELRLTGGVDEADIGKIRPGQAVEFSVDAYPNALFRGTVESVRLNATVQNNVVTYPVWINVQNPDLRLRPSMTATVDVIISRVEDAVRVPNTALRFRPTAEMYTALGLTPPTPGQGRAGRGRQAGAGDPVGAPDEGRRGAPGTGENQAARPPDGTERRGNLTPEQMREFAERFGGRGGRRGGAGAGTGQMAANTGPQVQLGSGRIDQYFSELPPTRSRAAVYTWNPETKELRQVNITLGVTDGQMSELISGDLEIGQEVVTGILLPNPSASSATSGGSNNPFQPQRGFGGRGGGRGR